jgi:Ca2+-binding RTX toxin-like protein
MATVAGGLFDPSTNTDIDTSTSTTIGTFLDAIGITEDNVSTIPGITTTVSFGSFTQLNVPLDNTDPVTVTTTDSSGVFVSTESGQTNNVVVTGGGTFIGTGSGNENLDASGLTQGTIISTGNGSDTVLGGQGSDSITGGAGDDSIYGGSGDDSVIAGPGNDTVDGGTGFDQAVVTGDTNNQFIALSTARSAASGDSISAQAAEDYDFVVVDGKVIVSNTSTGEQTTFENTEYIQIEDHTTIVNTGSREDSSLARMAQGFFGEQLTAEDLQAANEQVNDNGLQNVAADWLSADDLLNPATINDSDFLELMYNKVFGRDSDAEGKDWWVQALEDGSKTRADVLADFGWSDEGVDTYDGLINTFDDFV